MLVLSRRTGEAIVIDNCVRVTVQRVSKGRVRLLIEAPEEVTVDREEVRLRKEAASTEQSAKAVVASPCTA